MNFKGESRFDAALVADAGANPASSKHLVAAIPSIVRIVFGGTTVAIAGVIEGQRSFLFCCSDLSPSSNFCQSVPKTPMKVGEPWVTIKRAANHAGRWTDIPDASLLLPSGQCRRSGGSGVIVWPNHSVEPAIEKEARLRPQHIIFSRSRMGNGSSRCSCEGGSRGPASAIRFTLGAGRPACKCE